MATLSPTEAYLWDYIENHQQTVVNLSITQLSVAANVSPATIVRTMKKKGFNGYTEFRHDLLKRIGDTEPFGILDQVDDQIKKVIMQNQIEVYNTLDNLKVSVIEDSVQGRDRPHFCARLIRINRLGSHFEAPVAGQVC